MNILDLLNPSAIKVPLNATDKHEAIDELIDRLSEIGAIKDAPTLKQVVWAREQQRSTGIGEGLAIPHGKANCCDSLQMAIGIPKEPIEYGAVDGKPVKMLMLLASPPDKTADHIQALGKISRLMGNEQFRRLAYNAETAEDLYTLFSEAETAAAT